MAYRRLNNQPQHYRAHWSPVIRMKNGEWVAEFRAGRKFRGTLTPWAKLVITKAHRHADKLNRRIR